MDEYDDDVLPILPLERHIRDRIEDTNQVDEISRNAAGSREPE